MTKRLFIQRPDGKYLVQGIDYADQWTTDPHRATPMTRYENEEDTNEYKDQGCILVEFAVTLTPTGRTCADLYKEQREKRAQYQAEEAERQRVAAEAERLREEEAHRLMAKTLGIDLSSNPAGGAE